MRGIELATLAARLPHVPAFIEPKATEVRQSSLSQVFVEFVRCIVDKAKRCWKTQDPNAKLLWETAARGRGLDCHRFRRVNQIDDIELAQAGHQEICWRRRQLEPDQEIDRVLKSHKTHALSGRDQQVCQHWPSQTLRSHGWDLWWVPREYQGSGTTG